MGDYLNTIEWDDIGDGRSEKSSNASDISFESRSSEKSLDHEFRLNMENKLKEDNLIEQKYDLIKQFNKGLIDADIYWFKMSEINEQLGEITYEGLDISNELINLEVNYNEMLENITAKINKARQLNKKLEKGFLTSFDYQRLKTAHKMLKKLRKAAEQEETEEETKPFDYDTFDLEQVAQIDRVKYEKELKLQRGIVRPDPDNFATQAEYEKALEFFYDSIKQMLLFKPFAEKEKRDILSFAKRNKIEPPSIYDPEYKQKYEQFLTDVSQLLPGYVFKMTPTKIGFEFELLNSDSLKQKALNELAELEENKILLPQHTERFQKQIYLPVRTKAIEISDEEKLAQENITTLKRLLSKKDKSELIDCIFSPTNSQIYKTSIPKKLTKAQQLQNLRSGKFKESDYVKRDTIKLQGRLEPENSLRRKILTKAQKLRNLKGATIESEGSSLRPPIKQFTKDFEEYQQSDFHKRILSEVVKMYQMFQNRRVGKNLTQRMQTLPKDISFQPEAPVTEQQMSVIRRVSKQRLLDAIKINLPVDLLPFTESTINRLEEYIYKITGRYFLVYSNKIEDILFIFENYPFFKTKLLTPILRQNGNYSTEINIYQLALFEKEISHEARIHVYPVSPAVRRAVIQKLINEFKINLQRINFRLKNKSKSEILARIIRTKKAKELDTLLFNLSTSQSEYLFNANKIIEIIKVRPHDVLSGVYSARDLIQTLNIFNKNKKDQELLFERYLKETEKDTEKGKDWENISYKEFIKRILPEKNDFNEYTPNQLRSLIDDESIYLLDLEKKRMKLDSVNYNGEYILYWIPPQEVKINLRQKWDDLVMEIRTLLNGDSIKYYTDRRSGKYKINRTLTQEEWESLGCQRTDDTKVRCRCGALPNRRITERDQSLKYSRNSFQNQEQILKLLKNLSDLKQQISKDIRLEATKEHAEVVKEIIKTEENIVELTKIYNEKINKEQDIFRKRYITFLQNKYPPIPANLKPAPKEIVYENITPELVNQVVQAYKRYLIVNEPGIYKSYQKAKIVESGSVRTPPSGPKLDPNVKIINYDYTKYRGDVPHRPEENTIQFRKMLRENLKDLPPQDSNRVQRSLDDQWEIIDIEFTHSYPTFKPGQNEDLKRFYTFQPEKTNANVLITYLELYDLNEYYSKTLVNGVPKIDRKLYETVKSYLSGIISNLINVKTDFSSLDTQFKKKALQNIYNYLGLEIPQGNINEMINNLVNLWPRVYRPQKVIVDYYEQDLFKQILNNNYKTVSNKVVISYNEPLDFYDEYIIRDYEKVIKQFRKPGDAEFRRYGVLFNVGKGTYGDQALDGTLFEVELLDKNFATGQPFPQVAIVVEKDPRSGSLIPVQKMTYKRGQYAFIKRYLGTNQIGELNEIWHEVPRGAVKLYKPDYDSCNRFLTKNNCKGLGLGEKPCVWEPIQRKCVTSAFGRRKKVKIVLKKDTSGIKYKLSDSPVKRRKALVGRIAFEKKKKKCTLRQAAVAVKRRLVVLRTYRKNSKNRKQSLILSSDIKYIDKKYLK
jgi:hypothetical protein